MTPKVKVAVVGASGYGDSYLQALLLDPRNSAVDFVGVADPAPQRCRRFDTLKAQGVPFYPSLEVMLASSSRETGKSDIDLVLLATPIHLHAPHSCLALDRGISVLCEKPLAGSLADARRMLHASLESSEKFLAIGFQWSFSPAIKALKRDMAAGVFGRPKQLKCFVSFPRGLEYYGRNDWAGRVKTLSGKEVLDSPVNNSTAHYLHNMLHILGPTPETAATPDTIQAELYRANAIENYDTAGLRILTTSGAEILFLSTQAMTQRVGPLSVYEFENATVRHDALNGGELVATFRDGRTVNYGNPDADRNEKLWQSVAAVNSGAAPSCGVQSALSHTLCVIAAHKSCPSVHTIPAGQLLNVGIGDDVMVGVRDLDVILRECFDSGRLPSELKKATWAHAAMQVKVPHTEMLAPGYRPEEAVVA